MKAIDEFLMSIIDHDEALPNVTLGMDENDRLLLLAAFGEREIAVDAYKTWRRRVRLEDITFTAFRVLGQLVQTVRRYRIEDSDFDRIQGAVKHTWLSNMLQTRALSRALQALERADIDVLVLKGAALFARYPEVVQLHLPADFDILVRRRDAGRAFAAITAVGFRANQHRFDLFEPGDLQRISAIPLDNEKLGGSVDLHWWPLPGWTHDGFVEELFGHSEIRSFASRRVRVPSVAHHLYLTLASPAAWDSKEIFARATEAIHILRGSGGLLDWGCIVELSKRFHKTATVEGMLSLMRLELGMVIPASVYSKLRKGRSRLSSTEVRIGKKPVQERTSHEQYVLKAIDLARSHPKASFSMWTSTALRRCRDFQRALAIAANESLPQTSAEQLWHSHVAAWRLDQERGPVYFAGFSIPEGDGRWTDGFSATIMIAADAAVSGRVQVRLTVVPLLAPKKPNLRFEICGGRGLARWRQITTTDPVPAEILLNAEIVSMAEFHGVVVVMNLPEPDRPSKLVVSEDVRLLGLFVRNVQIEAKQTAQL
jgi:hypothetical protein